MVKYSFKGYEHATLTLPDRLESTIPHTLTSGVGGLADVDEDEDGYLKPVSKENCSSKIAPVINLSSYYEPIEEYSGEFTKENGGTTLVAEGNLAYRYPVDDTTSRHATKGFQLPTIPGRNEEGVHGPVPATVASTGNVYGNAEDNTSSYYEPIEIHL